MATSKTDGTAWYTDITRDKTGGMNNTLPDDIEQLKALLIAQQAVIVRSFGEITGYAREIGSLRTLVAKLQRMLFGRSSEKKREKIEKKSAWAETRITELQNRLGEAQLQLTSMAGDIAPKTSGSPVRKALPATLPRDRQVISPAETECPVCSGKLKPLGESISEQLDIINTAFRVTEAACWAHARRKIHDVHARIPSALTYYADDGWGEADNNIAENTLRAVSLGRKNFLFFGSDHGGERGALLYSLIETCKLCDVPAGCDAGKNGRTLS